MADAPVIESRGKGRSGTQSMLIPSRQMVAAALQLLPAGEMTDAGAMRRSLAAQFGADACCPVTVQRHLVAISQDASAPYWRVVDPERALARRMAGGVERIRERVAAERT